MKKKDVKNIIKKTGKFSKDINLTLKEKVRRVVEESNTRAGRLFDYGIQAFIIFSIIVYAVGTLPNLSERTRKILHIIDIICYVTFTIEYFSRIYIYKKKLKYIFGFYGIIDLLAILPFLVGSTFDLRALRALRVFKIISALRIGKYSKAMNRFSIAMKLIKPELMMYFIVSGIFIFLASAGIYYFEHEVQPVKFASIFHSLWWAIITLTTVGYGDVYPITVGGRVFTFFILLIGLGVVTIPAGLIASSLTKAREMAEEEDRKRLEEDNKNEQL